MRSAFVIGECGTGKSLMGAAIAHTAGQSARRNRYRVLVLGPPHLTRFGKVGSKWHREIANTVPPGSRILHIESHKGLFKLPALMRDHEGPLWLICSRNFLKTTPPWRAAFYTKSMKVTYTVQTPSGYVHSTTATVRACCCPACGQAVVDSDGVPMDEEYLSKAQRQCRACRSPLWQSQWPKNRRGEFIRDKPIYLAASWMKKHVKFDVVIADECHELKAGGSAQGQMLGTISACGDSLLAMTGTLFTGKASDLYYLCWRICPDRMRALGFDYGSSLEAFTRRYGIMQRTVEVDRDGDAVTGKASKKKEGRTKLIEKPGIVPTVFTDLLLDRAVFLSLDDLVPHLPPGVLPPRPRIELFQSPLGPLYDGYTGIEGSIKDAIKDACMGGRTPPMNLIAALFNTLDCWPDHPYGFDPLVSVIRTEDGEEERKVICKPPSLPDTVYPKDRQLLEIINGELKAGRRCLVYTVHTQLHPVGQRIMRLLTASGIKAAALEDVPTDRREEWIDAQVEDGVQVIVTHPGKVETGLDLLAFPTIIFHSMGTKPFTFRQAGARAWRIGQRAACRVIVLTYQQTMQDRIADLMFTKLRAAAKIEGQSLDALCAPDEAGDITDALLRELLKAHAEAAVA